jgi:hypothetical protein
VAFITLQAAGIAAGTSAAFIFWVANSSLQVRTKGLLTLIIVIIAIGMYLTVTRIDDPLWWQVSFTYLGKMDSSVNTVGLEIAAFALGMIWLSQSVSNRESTAMPLGPDAFPHLPVVPVCPLPPFQQRTAVAEQRRSCSSAWP